jgi:pantetheine-phosphate adenylyltransferase
MKKYNAIVSGGTFDHFHKGHKVFIQSQVVMSNKVFIGITSDEYVAKYKSEGIEPYKARRISVENFLVSEKIADSVELTKINNFYVPQLWQESIEAIAATEETKKGALEINKLRASQGLSTYPIEIIPHIFAQDGKILSSTRIRNGEVDREGELWIPPQYLETVFYLPEGLRSELKKPFGQLFSTIDEWLKKNRLSAEKVITIGDVVSESLFQKKFGQKIAVFDLFVQRKKMFDTAQSHTLSGDETILILSNPKSTIQPDLFKIAQKALTKKGKFAISIEGEEDLAVFAFILAAPLGYVILYCLHIL